MCACMFVYCRQTISQHVYGGRSEANLRCQYLPSILTEAELITGICCRLAEPGASEDSPVSTSYLAIEAPDLQTHTMRTDFTKTLGIQPQVFTLCSKCLYTLSNLHSLVGCFRNIFEKFIYIYNISWSYLP